MSFPVSAKEDSTTQWTCVVCAQPDGNASGSHSVRAREPDFTLNDSCL